MRLPWANFLRPLRRTWGVWAARAERLGGAHERRLRIPACGGPSGSTPAVPRGSPGDLRSGWQALGRATAGQETHRTAGQETGATTALERGATADQETGATADQETGGTTALEAGATTGLEIGGTTDLEIGAATGLEADGTTALERGATVPCSLPWPATLLQKHSPSLSQTAFFRHFIIECTRRRFPAVWI